jgi:hypothetical protein
MTRFMRFTCNHLHIWLIGAVVVFITMPVYAMAPIHYTDDFSDWVYDCGAICPIGPGSLCTVIDSSNSTDLRWDVTADITNADCDRWVRYTVTAAEPITAIEFDWMFAEDWCFGNNPNLRFQLKDENGAVLWTAFDTGHGIQKPLVRDEYIDGFSSSSLTFEYRSPFVTTLRGQPGLFALDVDWDALIDNVTLCFSGCSPSDPVGPTPRPHSPYGVAVHAPGGFDVTTIFDEVQAAGIDWVRVDIHWYYVQCDNANTYNWTLYDAICWEAEARGLNILASITTTPNWATSGSIFSGVPDNPIDFYNFCFTAAQRYQGRIDYWGLWNEANIAGGGWEGTKQQFIDIILKQGADGIHAGNPNAKVGGPELAQQVPNWAEWLKDCLEQAGDKLDFITHHLYDGSPAMFTSRMNEPSAFPNDPAQWLSSPPSVKEVLEYTGYFGQKPFWITEVGLGSCETTDWLCVGETIQARFVEGILREWFSYQPGQNWLDKVFIYEFYDQAEAGTPFNWGMITQKPNYARKPAWFAYHDFIQKYPAPKCLSRLAADSDQDCFVNLRDFHQLSSNWMDCNHPNPLSGCLP